MEVAFAHDKRQERMGILTKPAYQSWRFRRRQLRLNLWLLPNDRIIARSARPGDKFLLKYSTRAGKSPAR
jgi:hypothetical protein